MLVFGISLALSVLLTPLVRRAGRRLGLVANPRPDRWHKTPTPLLGGVGIFLACAGGVFVAHGDWQTHGGLLAGAALMFAFGLYDDFKRLTPPVKLAGQIVAAGVVVFTGYRTGFFQAEILNVLITMVWLVGITNAINLLDNMDGLASGIAFITACLMSFFFWRAPGQEELLLLSLSLAGATLGFLFFNFPPASIFMGDNGSQFLGFTLAVLAIARQPQASNVFAVMSVPSLIFLLPILDTVLVAFTRILRGESPMQGGRDHASHRLVAFGLSERQAVLVLYALALTSGVTGALIESLDYQLGLLLTPVVILSFTLLAAYLGRLKMVQSPGPAARPLHHPLYNPFRNLMVELTYRRRVLEIGLDLFIISLAYYLAALVQAGFALDEAGVHLLVAALPLVLIAAYAALFSFRIYQGVWEYLSVNDLLRFAGASLAGALLAATLLAVWTPAAFFPAAVFLYAIFLFLGLAGSRFSFRILNQLLSQSLNHSPALQRESRVLVYSAEGLGELAVRWILQNPGLGYELVGLLDPDAYRHGRQLHGVHILGGPADLDRLLEKNRVHGLLLATDAEPQTIAQLIQTCHAHGVWVKKLALRFESVEPDGSLPPL